MYHIHKPKEKRVFRFLPFILLLIRPAIDEIEGTELWEKVIKPHGRSYGPGRCSKKGFHKGAFGKCKALKESKYI
jgi:hypothetical protein